MTTLTMRLVKGDFIVTGPDVEPMKFKSRAEARDWCKTHHPGSPIIEVGPRGKRKTPATPGAGCARRGRGFCVTPGFDTRRTDQTTRPAQGRQHRGRSLPPTGCRPSSNSTE